MKKTITTILLVICLGIIVWYHESISTYIINNFIYHKSVVLESPNSYQKSVDYKFVQITDNFYPKNKQDILNIIYTSLDSGYEEFYFYCEDEYDSCLVDIKEIINDATLLSNVNNFVHPFNSFNRLYVEINNLGQVTINVQKMYTEREISSINKKIDTIISQIIAPSMSDTDKIQAFHDYVINNTKYDKDRNDFFERYQTYEYHSNIAYGALIEGYAICGGYSDAMAIFLDRMGLTNYKISSKQHVWNLVYLDNIWYHLDLTWDDPLLESGQEILTQNFFLITNDELSRKNTGEHAFDINIYKELE